MKITTENAYEAWKESLKNIRSNGNKYVDTDKRGCVELQNLVIEITRPDANIEKPLDYLRGFNDWVYPSKQELVSTMFSREKTPFYGYTYGKRMFNFAKQFDQINNYIIPLLTQDKNSRRGIIAFFDPLVDSKPNNKNVPGLLYIQVRILKNKVCLNITIRSNDIFFGWPSNLFQLWTLQKYLADRLGYQIGSLTTISNSAHVFEEQYKYMDDLL